MKEAVRRIDKQFGIGLTEEEIEKIAAQAEDAERLFRKLFSDDLNGMMPATILDKRRAVK